MGTWVWESRSASLFGLIRPPTPRMAVNPVRLGGLEGPNGLKMGGLGAHVTAGLRPFQRSFI